MIKVCILLLCFHSFHSKSLFNSYPTSLDWRQKGAVIPVSDQGQCASPSIINALDSISSMLAIKSGKLIQLSYQQIYDCGGDWCPCSGTGGVTQVFDSIFSENLHDAIDSAQSYPFTGKCTHVCKFKPSGKAVTFSSYQFTYNGTETLLMSLLQYGPVNVNVDANEGFQIYTGGIFDNPSCKAHNPNHELLVVGYGTENNVDYYIARNSWGVNWGEEGYIRIVRNKNMCGIADNLAQPML